MKREARGHSKMKRLCRKLDIPLYQAMGILECLWHLTATEAWRGDIGKLSNEDIALGLDFRGDEDGLIQALILTGWLDESKEHRLLVHDWPEHADNAVKKRAERAIKSGQSGFYQDASRHVAPKGPDVIPHARAGPEPEPAPEPAPALDGPTVEEIVCAHPLAVTRKLTELQVTPGMSSAVVDAMIAGETRSELLAKTQAIAQVVLSEWPPGELRFLKSIDRFFRECEFNKPLEEWRYGSSSDSRQTSRVSPSTDRGTNSRSRIGDAVARATGARPGPVDGRDASELSQPGAAGWDAGHVAGSVAGDGSRARPGRVPPRVVEGNSG